MLLLFNKLILSNSKCRFFRRNMAILTPYKILLSSKKAYKKDCVKRPKIAAPSNTTSFICDNNDEVEEFDLDDGFSTEYNARLNEEYEGEKERTNHEENINKRHDYLKQRLDKANLVSSR